LGTAARVQLDPPDPGRQAPDAALRMRLAGATPTMCVGQVEVTAAAHRCCRRCAVVRSLSQLPIPRAAARAKMTRAVAAWLLALGAILIVVSLYVVRQHRQHDAELAAKRSAAETLVARRRQQLAGLASLDAAVQRAFARFHSDYEAGGKAGARRHDGAIAGTMDVSEQLAAAKQEQDAVTRLGGDVERLASIENQIADSFEAIYGPDSVRSYRTHVQTLLVDRQLALSQWARAIGDIVDADQGEVNGQGFSYSSSTIEQYYQESAEGMTRSATIMKQTVAEENTLAIRLRTDANKAQEARRAAAALR
jgi:hypothetical protein